MDVFLLLILFLLSLASALCDAEDDFFRSRERYLQPLYTLPQHAPVTGLKFDYFPPHNPTRALIVATTPTRRMPVHSLYLDVFQKIHSLGFNAVSFYTFWGARPRRRIAAASSCVARRPARAEARRRARLLRLPQRHPVSRGRAGGRLLPRRAPRLVHVRPRTCIVAPSCR
jgi:hypothetical protein